MQRSEHRILTTHVGSLARPKALLELANSRKGPPEDPVQYAHVLRQCVADVVSKQASVGLDIINDGEFGKSSWANYILARLSGFEIRHDQLRPLLWLGRDRERFKECVEENFPLARTGT